MHGKAAPAPLGLETEADAYEFLERLRWGDDGPTKCPHCDSTKGAWFLTPRDPGGRIAKGGSTTRSARRVWKCRERSCRRQFSVLTNTVMHSTKMPIRAWVGAIVDLCAEPDGVSARDIAERWRVTENSASSMLMRIHEALRTAELAGGDQTVDEVLRFEVAVTGTNCSPSPAQPFSAWSSVVEPETEVRRSHENRAAEWSLVQRQRQSARTAAGPSIAAAAPRPSPVSESLEPVRRPPARTPTKPRSRPPAENPARSEKPAHRRRVDTAAQVRSDVERALAEAFAEPLPPSVATADARNAAGGRSRRTQGSTSGVATERSQGSEEPLPPVLETAASLGIGWLDPVDDGRTDRTATDITHESENPMRYDDEA